MDGKMNNQTATKIGEAANLPGAGEISISIVDLPGDLRRMLRMQCKEFIHHLEDAQIGLEFDDCIIRMTTPHQSKAA